MLFEPGLEACQLSTLVLIERGKAPLGIVLVLAQCCAGVSPDHLRYQIEWDALTSGLGDTDASLRNILQNVAGIFLVSVPADAPRRLIYEPIFIGTLLAFSR